jgi:ABC-type uncharacterized transport system ATPase subunit
MVMEQALYRMGERPGRSLAVSTAGLTKRFGDRTVVEDVALAIPSGSVCGFVGPNGAGKTTTIRMLLGLVRPTSGSGTILGGSLAEPATYLRKVGALIEAPAFYPQLSGRENLKVLARRDSFRWPGSIRSSNARPAGQGGGPVPLVLAEHEAAARYRGGHARRSRAGSRRSSRSATTW